MLLQYEINGSLWMSFLETDMQTFPYENLSFLYFISKHMVLIFYMKYGILYNCHRRILLSIFLYKI